MLRRFIETIGDTLRRGDLLLLILCMAASCYGLVMIYSATRYMGTNKLVIVQAAATVLGVAAYLLISSLDLTDITKKGWKWILLFNIVIILLLKTPLGIEDNTGNRAWLHFPFLPVNVQPSEFVKVTCILLFAKQLEYLKQEKEDLKSFPSVLFLAAHLGLIGALYYAISSDMGSVLVYVGIFVGMCFVAGVAKRWFVLGGLGGAFTFFILWEEELIPAYMRERFIVLFDHSYDPLNVGWHQTRSLLTLGGGKMTGQGLLHGIQTQSAFSYSLPGRHTDFIFSVIGEELGFVGCVAALVLLVLLIGRCLQVSFSARSLQERLVCVGVVSMLMFQVLANVGMCLFVMPVIGLTLPFFSYGGSSTVALYMVMGLVSSVYSHSQPDWLR